MRLEGSVARWAMMIKLLLFIVGALVAGHGANACCDVVRFDSTGLLAESENSNIIGTYVLDESGGYYDCSENGLSLYYYSDRGVSILPYEMQVV